MSVTFRKTADGESSVHLEEALKVYKKSGAQSWHQSLLPKSWQTTKEFSLWTAKTAAPWTYRNLVKSTAIYSAKAAVWTYHKIVKPTTIWTVGTAVPWTYHKMVKPATIWTVGTAVPWTYHKMVKPAMIWTVGAAVPWTYQGVTQAAQSTWKVVQGGSQKVSLAATTLWEGMQRLPQLLKNKVVGYHPLVNQEQPLNSHDSIEKSVTKDKSHIFTQAEVAKAIQAANEHLCQSMTATKITDPVLPCSVEALKPIDKHNPLVNITTVA